MPIGAVWATPSLEHVVMMVSWIIGWFWFGFGLFLPLHQAFVFSVAPAI
ncbi:hypothetical protein K788_0007394 (plasmid) [Paraburkholderia caribensis MBA4]|uniref:Uncharacterized protein n=1 Tax=Paraburkholderia caribensis MBA4 TaxID=1323664 RepID=A0A0P0RMB1_9BURK|nr:hypothetical protein K788_0007394 [Paraburkholderia caribensis MBA4]